MRTDDIELLLNQIKVIQDVAEDYHLKDIVFYGSRVLGRHQETSDFDLTCKTDHIERLIKQYPEYYPPDNSPDRWINLTLDEAGRELSYKLKADISLTSAKSDEELLNSIRQYHIPLITNGKCHNSDTLTTLILDLRSREIPLQNKRSNEAQMHYLMTHLAKLTSIVRFMDLKKSDFIAPKSMYKKAMRNEIIKNIATFSFCTEKVSEELFEKLIFNIDELKKISSLVRSRQHTQNNYNTLELGWTVCGSDDLERNEMELFYNFFSQYQKQLLIYLLNYKDHPTFDSSFHIVQRGLEDKKDLQGYFREQYKNNLNPLQKTPFKNILNCVCQREYSKN